MSVHELMTLARKHWKVHLPDKVKELRAEGMLEAATNGAANLAQSEIETLMKAGYQEHEAREVALPMFILLKPEYHEDEQDRELAEMESEYQKMMAETRDPDEDE
jgi:Holliday junction resolvasome RuvABC DNA-binding subunit